MSWRGREARVCSQRMPDELPSRVIAGIDLSESDTVLAIVQQRPPASTATEDATVSDP